MTRHPCDGMLSLSWYPKWGVTAIRLRHDEQHEPYHDIEVDELVKQRLHQLCDTCTPKRMAAIIASEFPDADISRHQIYYLWADHCSANWRRNKDAYASATLLLDELLGATPLPLPEVEKLGVQVIAWGMKDINEGLKIGGIVIQEVTSDATCVYNLSLSSSS
jgi:hypothetical protein